MQSECLKPFVDGGRSDWLMSLILSEPSSSYRRFRSLAESIFAHLTRTSSFCRWFFFELRWRDSSLSSSKLVEQGRGEMRWTLSLFFSVKGERRKERKRYFLDSEAMICGCQLSIKRLSRFRCAVRVVLSDRCQNALRRRRRRDRLVIGLGIDERRSERVMSVVECRTSENVRINRPMEGGEHVNDSQIGRTDRNVPEEIIRFGTTANGFDRRKLDVENSSRSNKRK